MHLKHGLGCEEEEEEEELTLLYESWSDKKLYAAAAIRLSFTGFVVKKDSSLFCAADTLALEVGRKAADSPPPSVF